MRKRLTLATLLLSFTIGADVLFACGDKFFLVGRGDRFSRAYATLHPGHILIYTGGTTTVSKGLRDPRLHKFITHAGHHVVIATDRGELDRVLKSESVDVVVASLGQAVDLVTEVRAAPSKPTLLPIEGDGADAHTASQPQFAATLKSSDKVNRFLASLEEIMRVRPASRLQS
ncbi:MAG TPA: hypothetical protein VFT47_19630 [Vicinamibacterales bacterium]|nr:hypothetical protein [Vicinamibacterales bacterium]